MTTTVPALHVLGPMPSGQFHVHAKGCADVHRSPRYAGPDYAYDRGTTFNLGSLRAVVLSVYGPESGSFLEEMDLTEDDWEQLAGEFKVFPCVGDLPAEVYLTAAGTTSTDF